MSKLLNTNSKEYKTNIEAYIFDCIDLDYFGLETNPTDKKEILQLISNEIKSMAFYDHNIKRYNGNRYDILSDHLQGLRSYLNIDFANYEILKVVAKLHNLDKLPDDKEDIILDKWWSHISNHIFKLFVKYGVEF
jgi:hypothetical protein